MVLTRVNTHPAITNVTDKATNEDTARNLITVNSCGHDWHLDRLAAGLRSGRRCRGGSPINFLVILPEPA